MVAQRNVSLLSTCLVVPAVPTQGSETLFMSNLDQVFGSLWYNTVWYFKPPPANAPTKDTDKGAFSQKLKDSLSNVLVEYPILAGRLTKNNTDGRYEVSLNDEGVIFREAITDARFDDWEDIKDCSIEAKLNTEETSIIVDSTPLVRFQVTLFECGGIALGYRIAHVTQDGWAAIEFMRSWSEVHLGLPISTPPVYATHMLKARAPPLVSVRVKDYISVTRVATSDSNVIPDHKSSYQSVCFRFTSRQVDDIVQEVEDGPWNKGRFKVSSFVAMAAFTWKVITEARNLPEETVTRYCYPISCRQRWQPRLPHGYFGNSAHLSTVEAKVGDLKNEHVSFAAKLIQDDLSNTTVEYLRSAIDWMEIEFLKRDREVKFDCDEYSGTNVQGTSVTNFPMFEVDFGWGAPIHHAIAFSPAMGDGYAYLFPAPQGGRSRLLFVYTKRSTMERLLRNQFFRKFHPDLKDNTCYG